MLCWSTPSRVFHMPDFHPDRTSKRFFHRNSVERGSVWFVFFGAAYAARLSAHNRVVIQFKLLPEWVGKYSMLITDILWLLFNGMMVKMSFVIIDDLREFPYMSPAMNLSMEYVYWIFPIAFTLMSLRILQVDYIRYILKQEIKDVDKIEAEDYEAIVEGGTLGSAGQANEKEEARV